MDRSTVLCSKTRTGRHVPCEHDEEKKCLKRTEVVNRDEFLPSLTAFVNTRDGHAAGSYVLVGDSRCRI